VAAFDALKPHAVLRKPFHHDLLLTALMERYSPKSESVAPVLERPVPYETDVRERPVALDLAIQHRCETLERAFPANDQNALVETCRALDPLLQRAGINATKWLELLIEKPDGITTLQTQLAFKNVVTSCRQAVARLRQPNEG
ncbi:MAG TPA: hypothetical protein VEY71_06325, partial [Chitinophagales bacterium]|nr:hypothetical protein [Chitinophagales bacterium]